MSIDPTSGIEYPDSDGQPIADNTLQYEWIGKIECCLRYLLSRGDTRGFVAGSLLWYPVEGDNRTWYDADILVAIGRPQGHRGSYMQWAEGGVAPQVIFEVLSTGNRLWEVEQRRLFCERHGVEEFYEVDPYFNGVRGWIRTGGRLLPVEEIDGWVSPLLKIKFELGKPLTIYEPDGQPFRTFAEMRDKSRSTKDRHADALALHLDAEGRKVDDDQRRSELAAARLRAASLESGEGTR